MVNLDAAPCPSVSDLVLIPSTLTQRQHRHDGGKWSPWQPRRSSVCWHRGGRKRKRSVFLELISWFGFQKVLRARRAFSSRSGVGSDSQNASVTPRRRSLSRSADTICTRSNTHVIHRELEFKLFTLCLCSPLHTGKQPSGGQLATS